MHETTVMDTSATSRAGGHQDRKNWTVWNAKPDHSISPKTAAAPGHRHEQGTTKDGSSTDEPGSSQGRTGPRNDTSANDEVKPDAEKSPKEVAAEQDRVPEAKTETKTELGPVHNGCQTGQFSFLNWIIQFL
jgi:hypothetical protein